MAKNIREYAINVQGTGTVQDVLEEIARMGYASCYDAPRTVTIPDKPLRDARTGKIVPVRWNAAGLLEGEGTEV